MVVKVQRPGIDDTIKSDISILTTLATIIEKQIPEARLIGPKRIVNEFFRTMELELDFQVEMNNCRRVTANFTENSGIVIPEVYTEYTTKKVLVMERFVDESLALRLGASLTFQEHSISAAPVIFLPGSARHPGTERRASGVKIYGVDGRFERLFSSRLDLERGERQIFPTAVINSALARDIGARLDQFADI